MSGILGVVGTAIGPVAGIAQTALPALAATGLLPSWIRAVRKINTIIPDVTIEESHADRLVVTQHPVASGSPISDHAYKVPPTITMRIGFSNSNIVGAITQGFMSGGGFGDIGGGLEGALGIGANGLTGGGLLGAAMEQRCKQVYDQLLKLQFNPDADLAVEPFTLVTGKRTYKSVVITELSVRTDRTSEYALMVECQMQEVRIVTPKQTTQPSQANQVAPNKTAAPTDQPPQNPTTPDTPPTPSPNSRQKDNPWLPDLPWTVPA